MAKRTHTHHIIPKHAGGTDDPDNLIELTVEEHAEAHRLLYEQYGNEYDRLAWMGLSGQMKKYEIIQETRILNAMGNNWRQNKHHSQETKDILAEKSKGNTNRKGKPRKSEITSEERKSLSERVKGDKNPAKRPEVRVILSEQKMGSNNPMYGKTGEQHHNHGVKRSDEQKDKMSTGRKEATKRQKENGTFAETLKYKNIILLDPDGNTVEVPPDYNEFFRQHGIHNFFKRLKRSGKKENVKGWKLVSFELNENHYQNKNN
jgi:hypothetical protein